MSGGHASNCLERAINPSYAPAGPRFSTLMQTLEFGLSSTDAEVAGDSVEALAALAHFHVQSAAGGGPGLTAHSAPGASGIVNVGLSVRY